MKTYDVVVRTDKGHVLASCSAPEAIPTGLILQAVMSHEQLLPHMVQLDANHSTTLAVTSPSRLDLPDGFSIEFSDGVRITGPLHPSPVPNVPPQFDGVQLTYGLAVLVQYTTEASTGQRLVPDPEPEYDDFDDDTE